jgi:Protein of unknown function (DUF1553)/Protein of unknown function (DUF1549)/Planctomycete cytochrome C
MMLLLCSCLIPAAAAGNTVVQLALCASLPVLTFVTDKLEPDDEPIHKQRANAKDLEFVREKIRPLLESRCFECHGDIEKPKGGLQLTSRAGMLTGGDSGAAIVPMRPDDSLLIQAVRYENNEMPPRSRLPAQEVDLLVRWVEMGSPWIDEDAHHPPAGGRPDFPLLQRKQAHWAWQPIARPPIPDPEDSDWSQDPIDCFIRHRLESGGLHPAPDASRRSLIRRIFFDLTGLPPSIGQQNAFINDPRPTADVMAQQIDALLNSSHFGERWARHWLDLVGYAETLGHEFDYPLPHAWRYRDYVIRAFNADVPYDMFLKEHIAGDLIRDPRRNPERGFNESIIGTGFWFLGEDKHAPVDVRAEEAARVDRQLDVFSKTFLGLTVACARCHDHKFDAISTQDYYALAGFLQSSRRRLHYLDNDGTMLGQATMIAETRDAMNIVLMNEAAATTPDFVKRLITGTPGDSPRIVVPPHGTGVHASAESQNGMLPEATGDMHYPLSLLADIAGQPSDKQAESVRVWSKKVLAEHESGMTGPGNASQFADFRATLPHGWTFSGLAFAHLTGGTASSVESGTPREVRDESGFNASQSLGASSRGLGPHFRGVLSSPTFELRHPEILVRVAGQSARLRLVVDGYVMNEFSDLLFKGLRQKIDTNGDMSWIRMGEDMLRYVGHRCHFEFLDEGDGWFCVEQIQFVQSPGDAPARIPKPLPKSVVQLAREFSSRPDADLNQEYLSSRLVDGLMQLRQWPARAAAMGLISDDGQSQVDMLRQRCQKLAELPFSGDPVLVIHDGSPENERVFIRGSHRNPGDVAPRQFLTALTPPGAPDFQECEGSGRLQLAELMLSDADPLPSRVIVNRIWHHLFGRGIVESVDNFGVLGLPPSHPQLLDHLATGFRADGWSVKRLIRRMMLTRTYRMSNAISEHAANVDPRNRIMSHANVRRLDGETLRDTMLVLSGHFDSTMFGRPVPVHLTEFMQGRGRPAKDGPVDGRGRRSIYQSVNRNFLSPFLRVFDTPPPSSTVGARRESNVPAQALMLLNNEFVQQQAHRWAHRILAGQQHTGAGVLRVAWQQAYCRLPTEEESELFLEFGRQQLREYGADTEDPLLNPDVLADVCHVLFNQKEFLFLD